MGRVIEIIRRGRKGETGNTGETGQSGQASQPVVTKGAAYTALLADAGDLIVSTASFTLSLTAAATLGDGWFIGVKAETGAVTIDPDGAETIDGAATLVLAQGDSGRIVCDGTNFKLIFKSDIEVSKDLTPQAGAAFDMNAFSLLEAKCADVASAAALPLLADGNYGDVTGTATITSMNAVGGGFRWITYTGILIITPHATNLICLSGASITTAVGDKALWFEYATGNWVMLDYVRKDGTALVEKGTTLKAILLDEKTDGTTGQTHSANTWTIHDLNTVDYNPDSLISIGSNQFTTTKDGYITVSATFRDNSTIRLYNVTDSVVVQKGIGVFGASGSSVRPTVTAAVTAGKTYRVEFIHDQTLVTPANTAGTETEVYLFLEYFA